MLRRLWFPLLGGVAVAAATIVAVSAQQERARILPIVAPKDAAPENSIIFADMGTNRLIRLTDVSDAGWQEGLTAPGLSVSSPWHMSFDSAGRIYLVDRDKSRIIRMDDFTGAGWVAFSGTGSNTFPPWPNNYISSTGIDAQGRIYITGSQRIVRIDNISGAGWIALELSRFAGGGIGSGNKSVAFDSQGRIYVSDNVNHRILRVNDMQGSGAVTFGSYGMGVGQFNEPEGLAIDAQNRIYISDESNHRIVRINDISGAGWTTLGTFGHGDGQIVLPHGVQVDSLGRIYIADTSNSRIVRADDMTGAGWVSVGVHGCTLEAGGCNPPRMGKFWMISPKGLRVRGTGPILTYLKTLPQFTTGGSYRTSIVGINTNAASLTASVNFLRNRNQGGCRCAEPLSVTVDGEATASVERTVAPMSVARIDAQASTAAFTGYATVRTTDKELPLVAFVRRMDGPAIAAEAALGLSSAADDFTIYIDRTNGAQTGYSIVHPLPAWNVTPEWWNGGATMTLRDRNGAVVATSSFNFGPGQQLAELVSDRFPQAGPGFEGSLQFSTGRNAALLRAAALRYDNPAQDVLTAMPVVAETTNPDPFVNNPEHKAIARLDRTTLYFPHLADGGGYRSSFLLLNPASAPVTATLEFFASNGSPLALPINGTSRTTHTVQLAARQVARIDTAGSSEEIKWGWARLTASERIYWHTLGGSVILQAVRDGSIASEAGVSSSVLMSNFATYVDGTGSAEAGIAVANPRDTAVTLAFTLRDSSGALLAGPMVRDVPARGHLAQFVTQIFPGASGIEGTLAVQASAPVAGIGLRYESVERPIFTTVPVVPVR